MHWQETRWIKKLCELSCSISSKAGQGHEEVWSVAGGAPTIEGPMGWLKVLAEKNAGNLLNVRTSQSGVETHMHGKGLKVWLVPCETLLNGEDMSILRMVALFKEFGRFPPPPTALFPCDGSTTSNSISEFTWRLKRASNILDEGEVDGMAFRLESTFLCSGVIVVTHPDTLRPQDQDVLLTGLGK